MRSKESFALVKSAKEIRVAVETDGDRIGGLLNERHPLSVGEGEPAFDYRKHMQHLVHQLNSSVDQGVDAEDAHSNQLIRVSRFQSERDDLVEVNHGKLVTARQGFESLYESGAFELASVSGDTPRAPDQLLEQLEQTVKLLKEPAVEPRELKMEGFSVDFDAVAGQLESGMPDFRGAINRLDTERKEAEGTLVVKRDALDDLRRTVLWVGRTAEGLFHLAGEDELAERIRSSTRRPLRPSEQAAEPPAGEAGSNDEPVSESQAPATSTES